MAERYQGRFYEGTFRASLRDEKQKPASAQRWMSVWGITFAAIFIAILVSEARPNTAAVNVNPVPPAIGATIGASWDFMLPVSTPLNAIVCGSS